MVASIRQVKSITSPDNITYLATRNNLFCPSFQTARRLALDKSLIPAPFDHCLSNATIFMAGPGETSTELFSILRTPCQRIKRVIIAEPIESTADRFVESIKRSEGTFYGHMPEIIVYKSDTLSALQENSDITFDLAIDCGVFDPTTTLRAYRERVLDMYAQRLSYGGFHISVGKGDRFHGNGQFPIGINKVAEETHFLILQKCVKNPGLLLAP